MRDAPNERGERGRPGVRCGGDGKKGWSGVSEVW